MPDDRQAVIDVQNAIKKRGCYARLMRLGTPSRPIWTVLSRETYGQGYTFASFCQEADEPDPGDTVSRALHICFTH